MPQPPEWEYQYRWSDIIAAGLNNSIEMLQERDYALEVKLRENCGVVSTGGLIDVSGPFVATSALSSSHTFGVNDTIRVWHIEATDCDSGGFAWELNIDGLSSKGLEIFAPTGGNFNCDIDLATFAITGTFPSDVVITPGFSYTPHLTAGQTLDFSCPIITTAGAGTPNPFSLTVSTDVESETLVWSNSF